MPMPEPVTDLPAHLVAEEGRQLGRLGGVGLGLEPGVDVLGVLPEDHHVDQFGVDHRGGHSGEPPHRPQAHVEVEDLAERHVERPDATADRCGQRALDADEVGAEGLDGLVGQPVAGLVERLLAGQDLLPGHGLAVLGGGGVEDQLGRRPDVHAGAIALDEGDDRLVGDVECAVGTLGDQIGHGRQPTGTPPHHRQPSGRSSRSAVGAQITAWPGPRAA